MSGEATGVSSRFQLTTPEHIWLLDISSLKNLEFFQGKYGDLSKLVIGNFYSYCDITIARTAENKCNFKYD